MEFSRTRFKVSAYLIISLFALISCTTSPDKERSDMAEEVTSYNAYESLYTKEFLIDDQHSYIGFTIKYFGYSPVRGRFNAFDGTLFYDEQSLGSISTTIYIDISTINTGNETRDNDLKEGAWFDTEKFPFARFQSGAVKLKKEGGFVLDGVLTIKNISKKISIDFEAPTGISNDWAKNEQVDFTGKAAINRQDFEVFGGDFWSTIMEDGLTQLSDEVEIEMNLHCRRPDYQARYEDAEETDIDKQLLEMVNIEGIDIALMNIDSLHSTQSINSGKLSTIGYTLQTWGFLAEANQVFNKKKELFGESPIVFNQLGINRLLANDVEKAQEYFYKVIELDSTDSRAVEYLRVMDRTVN